MKNIILAALALGLCSVKAMAYNESIDQAYSFFRSSGVICTSGTAVNITTSVQASTGSVLASFIMGGYRIQNQDATYSVWIGSASVSTTTVTAAQRYYLGEKLVGGANGVWPLSRNQYGKETNNNVQIYCKAEDACGASGVVLSVATFGYK